MLELKEYYLKSKNRRVSVLIQREVGKEPVFIVETKRLIDFKSRNILTAKTCYGLETFMVLRDLFDTVMKDTDVAKWSNPFSKFDRYQGEITRVIQHANLNA